MFNINNQANMAQGTEATNSQDTLDPTGNY